MIIKHKGFTLAEILVTLGVIGVVAALSLPTLMTNIRKRTTATKVKKTYSTFLQALKMSENDNGSVDGWQVESTSSDATRKAVNTYLRPYISGLNECSDGQTKKQQCGAPVSGAGVNYIYNGVGISIKIDRGLSDTTRMNLIITASPQRAATIQGRDWFYFNTDNESSRLMPYGWAPEITKEQILQGTDSETGYGTIDCDATRRYGCTLLLMLNNWTFTKDYPW